MTALTIAPQSARLFPRQSTHTYLKHLAEWLPDGAERDAQRGDPAAIAVMACYRSFRRDRMPWNWRAFLAAALWQAFNVERLGWYDPGLRIPLRILLPTVTAALLVWGLR